MSQLPSTLETVLCDAYREEIAIYTRALKTANEITRCLDTRTPHDAMLADLLAALGAVGVIEERTADARQAWQSSGCKPGPQLQALLDHAAQVITELAGLVRQAEEVAAARKAWLAPQLDASSRGRQMQRAYGAVCTGQ